MRHRHEPRLCHACASPLSRQEDACWSCGAPAPAERRTMPVPARRRGVASPAPRLDDLSARVAATAAEGSPLFTRHTRGTINADRDRRRLRADNGGANQYHAIVRPGQAGSLPQSRDVDRWINEGGSLAPGTPGWGPRRALTGSARR